MAQPPQLRAEMHQIGVGSVFTHDHLRRLFNFRAVGCVEQNPCGRLQTLGRRPMVFEQVLEIGQVRRSLGLGLLAR